MGEHSHSTNAHRVQEPYNHDQMLDISVYQRLVFRRIRD